MLKSVVNMAGLKLSVLHRMPSLFSNMMHVPLVGLLQLLQQNLFVRQLSGVRRAWR